MPATLLLTVTIPRDRLVAIGRQLTRLYRTTNSADFRGHAPGALTCSRIEGHPDTRANTMVYSLELTARTPATALLPADWSVLDTAVEQPDAVPYVSDPVLPVISHTPQTARGE